MTPPQNFQLTPVSSPVGSVITYLGNINTIGTPAEFGLLPEAYGWMLCDGRTLNPSEYPELFAALGYLYGGSGQSFNLPNLQGMFLRGVSNTPAAVENRIAAPQGTTNGVGSTQSNALQSHVHAYNSLGTNIPTGGQGETTLTTTIKEQTGTPEAIGSQSTVNTSNLETRPDNVFVYYLIKYTSRMPIFHATE